MEARVPDDGHGDRGDDGAAVTLLPVRNTLVVQPERPRTSLRTLDFEPDAGR